MNKIYFLVLFNIINTYYNQQIITLLMLFVYYFMYKQSNCYILLEEIENQNSF